MPTHYQGSAEDVLALNTFIKLTRAVNAIEQRLFQNTAAMGLTPSQFGVLEALYHLGPLCQGDLSARLLKSTGNMTLVIDNLEKQTLVQRVRQSTDRRMVIVQLTQKGEDLIKEVFPIMLAAIRKEFAVLTADEQGVLGNFCRTLGLQK